MSKTFSQALPPGKEAPALARRALERNLPTDISDRAGATLRLLVSELVTNSVRHAATGTASDAVSLDVTIRSKSVRVAVRDRGQGFDRTTPKPRGASGGFGLFLVEKMASRWGVDRKNGTCVWFELDIKAVED
jgi:anti-sigma regulatory factor (Ser/Thr protein kinase)